MQFKNKCILITGGTGSFGQFIIRRLLDMNAKEIRIFSRDEKKHYDLQIQYAGEKRLNFITGDVRDKRRVQQAVHGCEIVFHAAALKQVRNCEIHPYEAVKTNITGAQNVIDAAIELKVERFIAVSTDKAVKPVNVMGMTKALQERLVLAANKIPNNEGTKFCCVRYGNVMSSRGSAIPFFRYLVEQGKQVTITDVEMTRFLLTLEDAIDLVIYAVENMQGGEIYIKKAPAVKIIDLAKAIAEEKQTDFKYKVIGMFPGEKLHEILITEEELPRARDLGSYFIVEPWWSSAHYNEVKKEYNSRDNLIKSTETIIQMLHKSDAEFETLNLKQAVFMKS